MHGIRRKLLSQNFLHSPTLVTRFVAPLGITRGDLVLEIGPGKGIITRELLRRAGHVVAVEIDTHWWRFVQQHLSSANLTVLNQDFLQYSLPKIPYKVVANVPFSIEGEIVRKLIDDKNPPLDAALVVMEPFAERLAAPKPSLLNIQHGPWFMFSLEHRFAPTDFTPIPSVRAALLRFQQRRTPLLPWSERARWKKLVQQGFGNGESVWKNLSRHFPPLLLGKVLQELSVSKKKKPGEIDLGLWLQLYKKIYQ